MHGLFVNADHWRKNLPALAEAGYRAYAIDLLGNGFSAKPSPVGPEAAALSGERGRPEVAAGLAGVELGTAGGGSRLAAQVALAHPLGSCYNFYTWAEQVVAQNWAAERGGGAPSGLLRANGATLFLQRKKSLTRWPSLPTPWHSPGGRLY